MDCCCCFFFSKDENKYKNKITNCKPEPQIIKINKSDSLTNKENQKEEDYDFRPSTLMNPFDRKNPLNPINTFDHKNPLSIINIPFNPMLALYTSSYSNNSNNNNNGDN